ncbi:pre-mRNA-splicing factor syf2-like [Sinocyclocheilus grahami]|uniref:pre-mRNA-splicing factor syf2-like n=1 Tax=Sinocyclocheilus grahami TaxID=75366 RepID=UPI0007ACEA35|nr:PREDICTED: pre-mRNA-splicing factor syf2-like [Sinocyclocheilus grahami]
MASSAEVVAPSNAEEATETPAAQKREDRLRKFRELHFKRNEARKLNHQEVVEEDKRLKLPSNWEAKKARLEYELIVDQKKKRPNSQSWLRLRDRERSGYAEAQLRQYQRLTKQIKPDMENYERQREEWCVFRIEKRSKYSRRRAYNDDADIDYINERNAKFNKKAERFYGKYTAEIKQNLERGTAV